MVDNPIELHLPLFPPASWWPAAIYKHYRAVQAKSYDSNQVRSNTEYLFP